VALRVRRATTRDAEAIARQNREASREDNAPAGFGVDQIKAHAFGQQAIIELLVVEQDGAVIGHSATYRGYDIRAGQPNLILAELYVDPENRRGGIARLLISAVAKRAREQGFRRVLITAGTSNAAAHKFYEAIGAREENRVAFSLATDAIEWLAAETL
jgi:GNAT superfamily N-acetyltransferase